MSFYIIIKFQKYQNIEHLSTPQGFYFGLLPFFLFLFLALVIGISSLLF